VRKAEGKRPLGRSSHKWEDNIKMIFKKWDGGKIWVDLPQDRTSDGLLRCSTEPSIKCKEFLN
jgi:hypothetical protein